MPNDYYYTLKGKQYGPVGFETMQQLVLAGALAPADLIIGGQCTNWTAVQSVPGLAPKNPTILTAAKNPVGAMAHSHRQTSQPPKKRPRILTLVLLLIALTAATLYLFQDTGFKHEARRSLATAERFTDSVSKGSISYGDYRSFKEVLRDDTDRLRTQLQSVPVDNQLESSRREVFVSDLGLFVSEVEFFGTSKFTADEYRKILDGGVSPAETRPIGVDDIAQFQSQLEKMKTSFANLK